MKCPWKSICTCFKDSLFGVYIGDCCKAHDDAYESQSKSKEIGDENLAECVAGKFNNVWIGGVVASIIWIGVRIGGYATSWNRLKK